MYVIDGGPVQWTCLRSWALRVGGRRRRQRLSGWSARRTPYGWSSEDMRQAEVNYEDYSENVNEVRYLRSVYCCCICVISSNCHRLSMRGPPSVHPSVQQYSLA